MNNNNFEACKYAGGNPKLYFAKAIKVQQMAFKPDYAEKKLNQSCKTLISVGFCHGCRDCKLCALQTAHDETMKVLSDPEKAHKRYLKWVEIKRANEILQPIDYGAIRSYDGKGHETTVLKQTKKEKELIEMKRRTELMKAMEEKQTKKQSFMEEEYEDEGFAPYKESNRSKKRAKHEARKRQEKKNRYDSRWN